ncbi:hypothetical protein [Emergencia timonensis]|uniref:hypothetical protein n=1 Tax=Emergencia timonensis TaxID=1776384 RepID=UPI003994CB9C
MKIKTTTGFKVRRLAGYTRNRLPAMSEKSRRDLVAKWKLLHSDKAEKEVLNCCIVLKNLAIVHREMPMASDFILEQLMESSKALRNTFADMLSAYRNGKGEEAFSILYARVPIKEAQIFANILNKLDQINPVELVTHMTAFEETFASQRMTKGMKRAERKSLLTTLLATASVFTILLNFTIVVVFMDALTLLGQAF